MSARPPLICGTLLVAMMAAGLGHFLTVRDFASHYPSIPASGVSPAGQLPTAPAAAPAHDPLASLPAAAEGGARDEFFQELLSEVRALRNENKNLIDQVAETNRDMMKMEFRLDTHSESFRPLPTSEERGDTSSFDDDIDYTGVLPPRATPVIPLED